MRRLLSLVVMTGAVLGIGWALPAVADRDPQVERLAWAQTGVLPTFAGQDDTIYVAASVGAEEARAFIQLTEEITETPAGALVLLPESTDTLLPETAGIIACGLAGPFAGEGDISGSDLPDQDCSGRADAIRSEDGSWRVPIDPLRRAWEADAHPGAFVLLPDLTDPGASWRVAVHATGVEIESTTAREEPTAPPTNTEPTTPPQPATTSGTTTATAMPTTAPGFPAPSRPDPAPTESDPPAPVVAERPTFVEETPVPTAAAPTTPRIVAAATPPAAVPFSALFALAGLVLFATPVRRKVARPRAGVPGGPATTRAGVLAGAATLTLVPLLLDESTVFKAGLILIFLVAAAGLHVIVNWAGELSLAHAGMVGMPAFIVLTVSEVAGVSPVYLLPVGIVAGALVGAVVALPTLRATGLRVALVTLAAGLAIDRFFFAQTWLVGGPGGRVAQTPTLGPLEFRTSLSLYPFLVVIVGIALVGTWMLYRSKLGRSWFWLRNDPAAASAFGIPVTRYRILAYAVGGGLAGLAGALAAMWIGQLTPAAYPTTLSFTYLMVAVLSGPGYIGGLAVAALLLEGGRLFVSSAGPLISYAGPIALIIAITRQPAGLNGVGRSIMDASRSTEPSRRDGDRPIGPALIGGVLAILGGFVAITVGWYHAGNTDQVWVQNQEVLSGGIGGIALVIVGVGLLILHGINRVGDRLAAQAREPSPLASGATSRENGSVPTAAASLHAPRE